MKAHIHTAVTFFQKHAEEIGTGTGGFFLSKYLDSVILPIIVAAVCALVSSIVKDVYQRWRKKREKEFYDRFKQNGHEK